MTIFLSTLAVAFAAFCVWLTVRIVNRRERWAKWTLAAMVALPVLYVLSFGPACWTISRMEWLKVPAFYRPFFGSIRDPGMISQFVRDYAAFGMQINGQITFEREGTVVLFRKPKNGLSPEILVFHAGPMQIQRSSQNPRNPRRLGLEFRD